MAFFYQVYGLVVKSDQAIRSLIEYTPDANLAPDLTLRIDNSHLVSQAADFSQLKLSRTAPFLDGTGQPLLQVWHDAERAEYLFQYWDGTCFLINESGSEIQASWITPSTCEDMLVYLLGPVLSFVLRLRGYTCLHASSVLIDGAVIAVVGPSGAGKSTTAAAFADMGYPVLTEDVLPVRQSGDQVVAFSGYPLIRLWQESVEILRGSPDAFPNLTPTWDKKCFDLTGLENGFIQAALPLSAVYVLALRSPENDAPRISNMNRQESLTCLIANTHSSYLTDRTARIRDFKMLGLISETIPIRKVIPHIHGDRLQALCHEILKDVSAHRNSALAPD